MSLLYKLFDLINPARNSGGMVAMFKQMIVPYIIASLCFLAFMLPTVFCGSDSQATPINYKPIGNYIPPCGENSQENCVTHSPRANEHQKPCNSWDHCRGRQNQAGESESKARVSAATKQFGVEDHTLLQLGFAMGVGWVLLAGYVILAVGLFIEPIRGSSTFVF